jgi:predicted nuclease of predicted toxin-antitoxin system
MARLYSNENFDQQVVEELRKLGHDVLTAFEAGNANQKKPDSEVLDFAILQNRAVITFNRRDFKRLHRKTKSHGGIIICTDASDIGALAARIDKALVACPALDNQLMSIIRPAKP